MDPQSYLLLLMSMAAGAVVVIQQILKSKWIPIDVANKYPVPTNIVLSVGASIWVWYQKYQTFPTDVAGWLGMVVLIAGSAALVFNQLVGKWDWLRSTETK